MTDPTKPNGNEPPTPAAGAAGAGADPEGIEGLKSAATAERKKRQAAETELAELRAEKEANKAAKEKAAAEALEKQGEFKSLSETRLKENESLKAELKAAKEERARVLIKAKVMTKLPDVEERYLDTFFDFRAVKTGESGVYEGLDEAIAAFQTANPKLVGAAGKPNVPTRTNPAGRVPTGAGAGAGKPLAVPDMRDPKTREEVRAAFQKKIAEGAG